MKRIPTQSCSDGITRAEVVGVGVAANGTVVEKASTGNIAASDLDKILTNTGAGAGIVLTLLPAASCRGKFLKVQLTVAQTIKLTPQTGEKIYLGGSGVASKYLLIAGVIGNYCDIFCDGSQFQVIGYSGVLTKEI